MTPRRSAKRSAATYEELATACKARGFGAEIWNTGGNVMALALDIRGRDPDPDEPHLLLTNNDGPYLLGFENGDEAHDYTGQAVCVDLSLMLPTDKTGEARQSAEWVADVLADMVVSLLGARRALPIKTRKADRI